MRTAAVADKWFSDVLMIGGQRGQVVDRLARLADCLGKGCFALIIMPPFAALVHFDEMSQRPPGAEKLPFGILPLDIRRENFGHPASFATRRKH
jgi:hypothetical protein